MFGCKQEGYRAYFNRQQIDDNPYDEGTYAYSQWEQGWLSADAGEPEDD